MIQTLLQWSDVGPLTLRLVLGLILILHGWPKVAHIRRTEEDMEVMGFAPGRLWGPVVALVEFLGGLMLVAGLFTQVIAALLVFEFAVIIGAVKKGESLVGGYEFELLILAVAFALVFMGGGAWSADQMWGLSWY